MVVVGTVDTNAAIHRALRVSGRFGQPNPHSPTRTERSTGPSQNRAAALAPNAGPGIPIGITRRRHSSTGSPSRRSGHVPARPDRARQVRPMRFAGHVAGSGPQKIRGRGRLQVPPIAGLMVAVCAA